MQTKKNPFATKTRNSGDEVYSLLASTTSQRGWSSSQSSSTLDVPAVALTLLTPSATFAAMLPTWRHSITAAFPQRNLPDSCSAQLNRYLQYLIINYGPTLITKVTVWSVTSRNSLRLNIVICCIPNNTKWRTVSACDSSLQADARLKSVGLIWRSAAAWCYSTFKYT